MNTLFLSAQDTATAATAAEIIRNGGLVALPTETVYGLGANGLDEDAVAKIFIAKGRPQDNPLILHISEAAEMENICHSIPQAAYLLAEKFWPGPLTMVLPAKDAVPLSTRANLPSVAVRCPDCAITRDIIRLSGVPIAAPSANISGKPSTTTAQHVLHDHDGRIDCIVDGGSCRVGVESTIVDLTEDRPRLLRPGGITPEQLWEVLGDLVVDKAVTASVSNDAVVKAPGMKYRHYAPQCPIVIVSGSRRKAAAYIHRHFAPGDRVLCFEEELPLYTACAPLAYGKEADVSTLSAGLFDALRQLDDPCISKVYARCPEGGGVAYAVQNRLKKAAAFQVVDADGECVIGITGGSGSGKTTLLKAIENAGGMVLDCDAIYHRLLETDSNLLTAIGIHFPGVVVDGKLDRKKLGAIVFSDEEALQKLNRLTHTAVRYAVKSQLKDAPRLAAIDAIGLHDGELDSICDITVAVTAPVESRIARLVAREGISAEYAKNRISAQHSDDWFRENCDVTLENNGSLAEFEAKCVAFLNNIRYNNR